MNLITLATSRWGSSLIMHLCRMLPRQQAYYLGDWLSSFVARQKELPFVKALQANMAMVHGLPYDHRTVDQVVTRLLRNTVRGYIDLFRTIAADPAEVHDICHFEPTMMRNVEECLVDGKGLILVGAHTCSFDILLLALKKHFPSVQALTNAKPVGSSRVMNDLRIRYGLEVTPISTHALRLAVNRLRGGGVVAMAADMPLVGGEELMFFGRQCQLSIGHARLAISTDARIMVGFSHKLSEGEYQAVGVMSRPNEMTGDKFHDAIRWAQDSISIIESYICKWPEEWILPIPVWP